jgi:coenzyme PQQ precursor peptide PqqA
VTAYRFPFAAADSLIIPTAAHRLVEHRRSAGVRSDTMAWKTPKIVEIVCGAEINAYVSAEIA